MKIPDEVTNISGIEAGYTIDDWSAAVTKYFCPYVRRTSILHSQRHLLRSELINLARILPHPQYVDLLAWLSKTYHSAIRKDRSGAFAYLVDRFEDTGAVDARWMSLYATHKPLPKGTALEDRAFRIFDGLDAILEGCFKPHLRLAYGFAVRETSGLFPSQVQAMDFGNLVSEWPKPLVAPAEVMLRDPEYGISTSQWRNIAAHKNFAMKSSRTFEVEYGNSKNRKSRRITFAGLNRVLKWAMLVQCSVRLSNTLLYLEYMRDLHDIGLPDPPFRFDGWMIALSHNYSLVGFKCLEYYKSGSNLTLKLQDRMSRQLMESIIHASQILVNLSLAVKSDLSYRKTIHRLTVAIVDEVDTVLASASVDVEKAFAFADRRIAQKTYVRLVDFQFYSPPQAR